MFSCVQKLKLKKLKITNTNFSILVSVLLLAFTLFSCTNSKPRKPVMRTGQIDMTKSIAFNKKLFELETKAFKTIIKKDTLHEYFESKRGFWYAYDVKIEKDSITPKKGDEVIFSYDISAINGELIYAASELGDKTYLVDLQDFMQGIQEGIKMMKVKEKMIFLLPSQKAYGVYGDENKIGTNTPLIVRVALKEITNK